MDLIYDALDAYNRAGKLSFGVDIELEAISEAMIGKIWYKGLRKYPKAKVHLNNSIKLT